MRTAILATATFATVIALASCASMSEPAAPAARPATVAVTFDRESITPVIVEGTADRGTGRAVTANDPVRVASISKLIMALAALRLVDEGKVDLDADVSDYLGWQLRNPAYRDVPVTLAQLMSHSSGLRDGAGYVIPLGESLEAKLGEAGAWYAGAPPGEAPFEYANLGSPVVATVLEAASGERFDRLVERTVFAPLGIRACFNWIGCDQAAVGRAVTLYRSTGEVARDDAADLPPNCTIPVANGHACSLEDYVPGTNASIFSPQGGVRIGMGDLARLGQALMNEDARLLSPTAKQAIDQAIIFNNTDDQEFFCAYGLHVQMIQMARSGCDDSLFADGLARLGHAGEAYGLRSGLWFHRRSGTGIAYFISAVPDRSNPDEGGFAPEEIELVRRATARRSGP